MSNPANMTHDSCCPDHDLWLSVSLNLEGTWHLKPTGYIAQGEEHLQWISRSQEASVALCGERRLHHDMLIGFWKNGQHDLQNFIHTSLRNLFICTTTSCGCLKHMQYSDLWWPRIIDQVEIYTLAGQESDEECFLCSMKDFPFKAKRLEATLEIDIQRTR